MDRHVVRVGDAQELITSIPGMLGFVPERSLIVVAFESRSQRVVATIRHDLALTPACDGDATPECDAAIEHLAAICHDHGIDSVISVIVDERYPHTASVYQRVFETVQRNFEPRCDVVAGFVASRIAVNEKWTVVLARPELIGNTGILGDPHTSSVAVAHAVTEGRRVVRTRQELEQVLTPRPLSVCRDLSCVVHGECVESAAKSSDGQLRLPECSAAAYDRLMSQIARGEHDVVHMDADTSDQLVLSEALRIVEQFDNDLDCLDLAVMKYALTTLRVRDALLGLADTVLHGQAQRLYAYLAQHLTGIYRASSATMLAHLHYWRGDGAMAGVAFDAALAADPRWSMAQLLDRALRTGMSPSRLSGLIDLSHELASDLGVVLPARLQRCAG